MTSGSLSSNAVDLRECSSNLFTLTDINALKWCKYTGNLCSLDRPLDDAVLASFANALENNVLCSWRHSPPHSTQRLNQGLTCSESAKELWLFWYGDDPRTNNIVDSSLKETDHGSWESNFPNEAKVLLFKALHNTLERHLLSRDYVRVGKWFVNLDKKSVGTPKNQLFLSFAFCLQGENKICLTVDVKELAGVRHIVPDDLARAAAQGDFKVIIGPYGIQGYLTGHSYHQNGIGVSKLIEDWKRFFPLHVVDDWTSVPEGIEHDVPVVVEVTVEGNFIKCPSHYVLVSLDDESCEDNSEQLQLPMTPPASPFIPSTADKKKQRRASTAPTEIEAKPECTTKVSDSKAVACELVNEAWKDITATKSTTKTSAVATAQSKAFGTNFKADQESFWNLREPLSRKSCSCTSSSNVSRSRTTPPNRPFGINRPNPTGAQNSHSTLANKMKKERERKPILPFHQRVCKQRNISPASKGLSTVNLATYVADQNRQPNSQNEANPKSTDTPDGVREKPKPSLPFTKDNINNNNNNVDEAFFKPTPPVPTRLSGVVRSVDDRKKPSLTKDDVYMSNSRKSTSDVWKCYDIFTGDSKLKPRLPDDVLDFRDGERLPLTTQSVVSMPENSGEVFKIETIENKSYQNKRPAQDDHVPEAPVKRMRRSSSASQSGRNKPETAAGVKARGHRNSSSSKPQIPAPSPEPSGILADSHDSVFHPTVPAPRGRANSTSSNGSAVSPAPNATSSKTSRNAKARRQSRKSQDKKPKEPVIKQEPVVKQEVDPVLPSLASPPTPRGSVSLRTEKDLQVTISDLDNMFDYSDEDEEDSKPRTLSVFTDDHSPPVHHGHDDSNQKTKTSVSAGPGVVSHADLVRMFPTPPMLENHPNSPQPTTTMAHTPPEVCAPPNQSFTDVVKNVNEEITDMLNELKEMPPIFEIPTKEDYLCSSTAIPPLKALPSSRLPPLKLTEDMVYTPSSPVKSPSAKSDSISVPDGISCTTRASLSDAPPHDLGFGAISVVPAPSHLNTLPPKDTQSQIYTPDGDHKCNLLNANLFLSDTYINYTSDTNLDSTNTCLCITENRKHGNRSGLCKEPIGLQRNNDVCQCGLGIFEREKLLHHTGLFSNELLHASSCMENLGVTLDIRYCDTARRKSITPVVKKELKDIKPGQCTELLGTANSTILVENLLNQFSSPLSASATSEKLVVTGLDHEVQDTTNLLQVKSASEVEKVSKTTVEFLVDLKPVIQESLHKAIHWKTWDQLSTVQGPLSLKQLCQVNSKGPVSTGDPARIPRVIVGHDGDWLSVSPLALHHWEKLLLEPYTSSRDVTYIVLAPENETTNINVKYFFRELSSAYETCQLGRHVPVSKISSISSDGILRIGPKHQNKYGKNVVSPWFAKYENLSDGPRVKLFAQVCKYELGPFLEKLPLEKLNSLGDDGTKKNSADTICDNERQDNTSIVVYMVNPFDESNEQVLRRESYYALLRSFSEMASGLPEKLRTRLVLEIIPLRQITQVDAYQKTKGSLVSFVKLLKTTAFSVFSRCRIILHRPCNTRVHTGFWAPSSQRKTPAPEKTRMRVHSPAYILATPTKLIHNVNTVENADDLGTHKETSSLLFCCYGLSDDQRWLLASCTDETGMLMETFVTMVEPNGSSMKQRRARVRIKALMRLWEFCQGITSTVVGDWRLVIGKLGRISRHELRDWDEVIRGHSPHECTEGCDACSSSRSHARFQSVSVVSLHNELCLRVHLAKVTTAFSNYREPETTIVESVTRQRISTSFIVINIENSQSVRLAQLDGIHDVGDRGGLMDNDLMMSEPNMEDDDEMPLMPFFGTTFPSSRISHLQDLRGSSPHERPSSAPMLTDPVTSSFVPIGLQSPHPSQSACSDEQSEQEKNLGFPLAHGRIYTTAPLGSAFKQFSREGNLNGNSPVILKAALLLHRVDETGRQGNHVLSSNTHTNVLRYILEQYDALSWLTVDSVSEDRTSCLPVHYITLSQMTQAFNGLLS